VKKVCYKISLVPNCISAFNTEKNYRKPSFVKHSLSDKTTGKANKRFHSEDYKNKYRIYSLISRIRT